MTRVEVFKLSQADVKDIRECTTVITGGSAGIGLQTALILLEVNARNNVVILDRQAPSTDLTKYGSRVLFCKCDITEWKSQRQAFAGAVSKYGRIDHVFVNAGINEYQDQIFKDLRDSDGHLAEPDHRTINIDLKAAIDTVKLAIHHIRQNKLDNGVGSRGSIVLTASLAGYLASAGLPLYSAAKHGVVGLMRALKNDVATLNIAVSLVAPGITLTDILVGRDENESLPDWATRMRKHGVPINEPGEIATAVVYLFSQGMRANGRGLLIQNGMCADVEAGLARSRSTWMGTEMLALFKGGRDAPLMPNKL